MPATRAARRRPQARPAQSAHFDARLFAEASAMLKELRRLGLKPRGYHLASPYGRPRFPKKG